MFHGEAPRLPFIISYKFNRFDYSFGKNGYYYFIPTIVAYLIDFMNYRLLRFWDIDFHFFATIWASYLCCYYFHINVVLGDFISTIVEIVHKRHYHFTLIDSE